MNQYLNDNNILELKPSLYPDLLTYNFVCTLAVAKVKNTVPTILRNVKTAKDLRLLFQADCELTMKAIKSLPRIGEKTAWLVYNYVTSRNYTCRMAAL